MAYILSSRPFLSSHFGCAAYEALAGEPCRYALDRPVDLTSIGQKRLRGSFSGLVNMIIFLLGINFVASLIVREVTSCPSLDSSGAQAVQYFRGMIPQSEDTEMTFYHMWNSLLAMYQVCRGRLTVSYGADDWHRSSPRRIGRTCSTRVPRLKQATAKLGSWPSSWRGGSSSRTVRIRFLRIDA